MQTKKKISAKTAREHASPRVSRQQRKLSENVQVAEKKVTELITSSARKQKSAGFPLKQIREVVTAENLSNDHTFTGDKPDVFSEFDAVDGAVDHKGCHDGAANGVVETIFSPSFQVSKDVGVDFLKYFRAADEDIYRDKGIEKSQHAEAAATIPSSEMDVDLSVQSQQIDMSKNYDLLSRSDTIAVNSDYNVDNLETNLSSEVSAIYYAMQQSKLECIDEPNANSMSTDSSFDDDDDDDEEIDYFDPFLFIKNLPDLSTVVPTYRPMLLPKQTRRCPSTTLVLDLDETLVHSSLEPCYDADFTFPVNFNLMKHTVYVRCRPHLMDFMERVASLFEIIIFTASQSIYAEQLLNVLDPKRRIFRHRVYRDSCVFVDGNYLKDLSILGRDLAHVIIVDNSPQAFGFQVENGVPIESWFDDHSDNELLLLLPFLETMIGVEDVRPLISKKFNLRGKIEAAVNPSLNSNKVDPFRS